MRAASSRHAEDVLQDERRHEPDQRTGGGTPERATMTRTVILSCVGVLLLVSATWAATFKEIDPGSDLCAEINAAPPGTELVLQPGDYRGPCRIRAGGIPGDPLMIRAKDPAQPPHVAYAGTEANVFEIQASYVTIRGLAFGPTRPNVDAVRVFSGDGNSVEDTPL